ARLLKVLVGTGTRAKPSVIGEVQEPTGSLAAASDERPGEIAADVPIEPAGPFAVGHRIVWKNDLVADERQKNGRDRHGLIVAVVARDEPAAPLGELLGAEPLQQILKRQ